MRRASSSRWWQTVGLTAAVLAGACTRAERPHPAPVAGGGEPAVAGAPAPEHPAPLANSSAHAVPDVAIPPAPAPAVASDADTKGSSAEPPRPPLPLGAPGEVIDDAWLVVRMMGKPGGYVHAKSDWVERDGRTLVRERSKECMSVRRGTDSFDKTDTSEALVTPEGELVRMWSESVEGDQRERVEAENLGRSLRVVHTLNGVRTEKSIPVPEGETVSAGMDGWQLFRRGLETGRSYRTTVFAKDSRKLVHETTIVGPTKTLKRTRGDLEVFVVTSKRSDMPGVSADILVDCEGRLRSMKALFISMERTTRTRALAAVASGGLKLDMKLPLKGGFAIHRGLERLTLLIEVEGDDEGTIVCDSDYQKVVAEPGRYELTLGARAAPTEAGGAPGVPGVPVGVAEFERYTRAADYVQSDHPEIRAATTEALAGQTEPVAMLRHLCRWVYANLAKESPQTSTATALESLRARTGDCSEHAALFCALARAAGIPAREVFGIVLVGAEAGYHAWNEAYVAGAWLPIDATVNAVGLGPTYVSFGTSDGNHADFATEGGIAIAKLFGRSTLTVTSATRRGVDFDPADLTASCATLDDVYRNMLLDVTVDLGGGWRVLAHTPAVQVLSPAGVALAITGHVASIESDEDWTQFDLGFARSSPGVKLVRGEDARLGSWPCRTYAYTVVRDGAEVKGALRVASRDGTTYSATVVARAEVGLDDAAVAEAFERVTLGVDAPPAEAEPDIETEGDADEW